MLPEKLLCYVSCVLPTLRSLFTKFKRSIVEPSKTHYCTAAKPGH